MPHRVAIEIANVDFMVTGKGSMRVGEPEAIYETFTKNPNQPPGIEQVSIAISLEAIPDLTRMKKIFETDQSWSLLGDSINYYISFHDPSSEDPFLLTRMNHDFSQGTIYPLQTLVSGEGGELSVPNPIHYPLDQIILLHNLCPRRGALVHAAGASTGERAFLFAGKSGAGKSTLSRILADIGQIEILSDDRMVVRELSGAFRAFGTPWPGDLGAALNKSAALSGIFFICHGRDNSVQEISFWEAFERLLSVTSVPWYDKAMVSQVLSSCEDMVQSVPAYELSFRPDSEVMDVLGKYIFE